MKNDNEKLMQLMRDIGEVNEKFIDEADTDMITVQKEPVIKISRTYIALAACAAAAAIVIGINLPEKNNNSNTLSPALTDMACTDVSETQADSEPMNENPDLAYESVIQTEPAEQMTEEIKQETDTGLSEPEMKTEQSAVSDYSFTDDIKGEGVSAFKNSDNSITVTFEYGKFALTVPAEWENHFVAEKNGLYAKQAYNNGKEDGKLIGFAFGNEYEAITGISVLRGYSTEEYWYSLRVTDVRYDAENTGERSEYEKLMNEIDDVYYESKSSETGEMSGTFAIPDFTGEVRCYVKTYGYTDSFVEGLTSEETSRNWPVENEWHITAVRGICVRGQGMYYDCYDTDDNDHYGWISSDRIEFYVS